MTKYPPVTFFLLTILSTFVLITDKVDNTLTLNDALNGALRGK